jgi:apolipoprotein N-acyltransferase
MMHYCLSPISLLFLGGLCYYIALPPLNIAPLALAVPICWGIAIKNSAVCRLPSAVFIMAMLFWLASIWWVTCPHTLLWLGLLALSATLSGLWLLFFISTRVAVHRFHIPLLVAMPICWIGTEYIRCHLFGGFSFCALEHAFYQYPACIQLASIGGSMLVGGAIMLIGAAILPLCELCVSFVSFVLKFYHKGHEDFTEDTEKKYNRSIDNSFRTLPLLFILPSVLIVTLFYMAQNDDDRVGYSIVALQGNKQIHLHSDIDKARTEANETFEQFVNLTYQTIHGLKQTGSPLPDVIIFPETVCPIPALAFEGTVKPADVDLTDEEATDWERQFRGFVQQIETPVILGLSTLVFKDSPDKPMRLNSALLVEPTPPTQSAALLCRYDKMHLVMFGEYIPFAEYLPEDFILRSLCPEAHHGNTPVAMPIGQGRLNLKSAENTTIPAKAGIQTRHPCEGRGLDVWHEHQSLDPCLRRGDGKIEASVNICFESSVSHLIRSQILTLRRAGHNPQVLINMSNDGWFRFSQEIEQHLATHVFRAVENRMYYIAATNGGYSVIIDPQGNIVSKGKRGAVEAVSGTIYVSESQPTTIYQRYGDWYALAFAIGVLALVAINIRAAIIRLRKHKEPEV